MTGYKLTLLFVLLISSLLFVQCKDDDDNSNVLNQELETCDDGIQNAEEEGVDCGGAACEPCDDNSVISFEGNYVQEDMIGRPGANTIFGGSNTNKNYFNITEVSNRNNNDTGINFQPIFELTLENYHDIYAVALEIPKDELNYETNILGWNAQTFSKIYAHFDALQVAPDGPTTFYDATNNLVFTGRKLSDDVIDVSLTLMFGGVDGTRFDGNNETPQLTTDGVDAGNRDFSLPFPYLEVPINE